MTALQRNNREVRMALPFLARTLIMLCVAMTIAAPVARAQTFTVDTSFASPLTGLWWNESESGWGATLTQQSTRLFVTMFVYDVAGNATWYTVSCAISGTTCAGDLLRVRGGAAPTAPWAAGVSATRAGNMLLTFSSNDAATMSYTLDGVGATRQITRQLFGPLAPVIAPTALAGTWFGSIVEARSNCTQPPNNGNRATYGQYDIIMGPVANPLVSIHLAGVTGLQCTYSGTYATNGARVLANGTLSCNDGRRGNWQSGTIDVKAQSMALIFNVQLDTIETCSIYTVITAARL